MLMGSLQETTAAAMWDEIEPISIGPGNAQG
jgi:hypothetical protein